MNSYEEHLKREETRLLNKIEKLEKEIEEIKGRPIGPTETWDYVDDIRRNSDTGMLENWGKKFGRRFVSADEVRTNRNNTIHTIEKEIKELYKQVGIIKDELLTIEWNKPENVAKRKVEEEAKKLEEQKTQIVNEKAKHEEILGYLDELIKYLKIAELEDLAQILRDNRLGLAILMVNDEDSYIKKEIDIRVKETGLRDNKVVTKKELRQISRTVKIESKHQTSKCRKYQCLYDLATSARSIIRDIKSKMRIDMLSYEERKIALKKYFTEPISEYFIDYETVKKKNLGYECLEFYRDYYSKYNEGVRKHKI